MSGILSHYALPLALGAVAVVLAAGLVNMTRGNAPNRSQLLMRWRVALQFGAIVLIMLAVWYMGR